MFWVLGFWFSLSEDKRSSCFPLLLRLLSYLKANTRWRTGAVIYFELKSLNLGLWGSVGTI